MAAEKTQHERVLELLKELDEEKARRLLELFIRETGEKLARKPASKEELVGALVYLVDKYPKLQKYIPVYEFDEFFDRIEHFNMWDVVKKVGEALFGEKEKPPSQPSQPVVVQTGSDIPGWVWIALIGFMLLFLVVALIIALAR